MTETRPGHVAPPLRCVRTEELVARDGGTWRRMAGAEAGDTRVRYALPAHATAEVAEYLRGREEAERPEQFMARLEAGRVYGAGAVLAAGGDVLARDVAGDLGKPFERHWLLGHGRMREPERLDGVTAVAAVNLGAGYCHWLLEELPRVLRCGRGEAENLIVHAATSFAREALAARGGDERVIAVRRTGHFACGPLVVPSLVDAPGAPTEPTVRALREFAETKGLGRGLKGRGEKIYLTRERARRRRVVNEAELWAGLEARGFVKVALEELGWAEQIAVCREARVVVAPHGAGLANLVFCAPGTRVAELAGRSYFNPVFWRLAALGGLDYRAVVAPGEGPLREEASEGAADIVADVGAVWAALGVSA